MRRFYICYLQKGYITNKSLKINPFKTDFEIYKFKIRATYPRGKCINI